MKDIKESNFISKSTKKSLLLVVNVILIVALLAIATYAWFFRNLADNVDTEQIQFTAGLSLEVSLTGASDDYANDKTIVRGTDYSESALAMELTGDGIPSHFKYPTLQKNEENESIKRPDVNASWPDKSLAGNVDYIHKTLYFRSTIPVDIYLTNNSYFKATSEIDGKPLVWTSTPTEEEKEDYRLVSSADSAGNYYSKDCVVGAARAAFIDTTTNPDNPTTKLLWVPRPDIFCNIANDSDKVYMTAPKEAKTDDYYSILDALTATHKYSEYVPSPDTHWYYTKNSESSYTKHILNSETDQVENGKYIVGTSKLPKVDATSSKYGYIGSTKKVNDGDEYYTTQVDVTIWIDGCDAEARKEFVGGKFSSKFQFVGISNGE
ncbi:MAG: hypothetical protein ACI4HZ_09085 [Ruminococcus sp.]